jgi:3-deoxy-D-manno-octulosonic-acid transferase
LPWLYALVVTLIYMLTGTFLARHRKLRGGLGLRHGLYPRGGLPMGRGPRVWWHGSSAGDILALEPLIRELCRRRPDVGCVLSAMTSQGLETARRLFPDVPVTPQPFDVPWAVRGATKAIRPDLLVLEYAELWPGLIRAVSRSGARLVLTNGHLGEKRLPAYRRLFRLAGNPLPLLDKLLMRDEGERMRAVSLGADPARVFVAGNTKFDLVPTASLTDGALGPSLHPDERALLWVAGSTHEGEEPILLETFASLRERWPALRLLVAPRYNSRAEEVRRLAEAAGWRTRLRSATSTEAADVIVVDTMGELREAYRLASLVFVGGSFVPRGGQNILEPAVWARPVVYGPHMHNFEDAVRLLSGNGGHQVEDGAVLTEVCSQLLEDAAYRQSEGEKARIAVESARGATVRHVEQILTLLPPAAA